VVIALVALLGGLAATFAVCYPLGLLAHALEGGVDWPVFRYFEAHQHPGWWTDLNKGLTLMGNRPQIKVACVVAAVLLAVLWRRRGWYIPPAVIAVTFVAEKYLQRALAVTVHRGHPPTSLGTYVSGGVARLITVYGTILLLALLALPRVSRAWRAALWAALGLAAVVEGYTRVYLLKHWLTDVIGGVVFGAMLLATIAATTMAVVAARERSRAEPRDRAWMGG
jgi:membrane-associated phospholipid phosphatase